MNFLKAWDLVFTPIFLLLIIYAAKRIQNRKYPVGHPLRKYFIQGLYLKLAGAIFVCFLYTFYYDGGDTTNYLDHAEIINSSLSDSFTTWLHLMQGISPDKDPKIYEYTLSMYWYGDAATYTVARIAAFIGLFNGTSLIPISVVFAAISYSGIWAMYETFEKIYPKYYKQLAIAFLFIPGVIVWGSPLLKDPICIMAMGWMIYTMFRIFINRDFSFKNIFVLGLSFYLIAIIKIYILLAFVPAMSIWVLLTYSKKIQVVALRWVLNIGVLMLITFLFSFFASRFAEQLDEYSIDNIAKKAQKTQSWITYVSNLTEGSAYDLGKYEPTLAGMMSKFPQAVNVTLFRPYIWEAKKPIVLLSAFEALAFLGFTLYIIYKIGPLMFFRKIFSDPNLSFFFIFTIVFAFAIGISTGNFGTLSRYKIPCVPFFTALLLLLYGFVKEKSAAASVSVSGQRAVPNLA